MQRRSGSERKKVIKLSNICEQQERVPRKPLRAGGIWRSHQLISIIQTF
jgi:hypothetical protein